MGSIVILIINLIQSCLEYADACHHHRPEPDHFVFLSLSPLEFGCINEWKSGYTGPYDGCRGNEKPREYEIISFGKPVNRRDVYRSQTSFFRARFRS